jgi:hypothetical protein
MLVMSAAFFAGLRLSHADVRVGWDGEVLKLQATKRPLSVSVRKGATNVLLFFDGTSRQLTVAEDAGFIIQGRDPPK